MKKTDKIRTIAIYLPQYHIIPENNKWWGDGFTEWTNTSKAKQLFTEHYQPHIPSNLGYYDLANDETLIKQSELAKEYGISGFCFYHYWFNGKQLLETPVNNLLKTGKPDFPFCLCWANENWTKSWDGLDDNILMPQNHNFEDDYNFIHSLFPFFADERYIKIDGKPLLIIYRTELFPDMGKTSEIWREEVKQAGFNDVYLVRVEGFIRNINPNTIGFDAAMEFAPDFHVVGENLNENGKLHNHLSELKIYDYKTMADNMVERVKPPYKMFRSVTPSWDNTPRKKKVGTVLINSFANYYENWLKKSLDFTEQNLDGDEKIIFINAWNEWGEGNHLEPDKKNKTLYLEKTKSALIESRKKYSVLREAENFIAAENYESAKKLLNELVLKNQDNIESLNDLVVIYILENNLEEALINIKKVFAIDPNNEIALENFKYINENFEINTINKQNSVGNMNINNSNEKIIEAEQFIENDQLDKASEILKDLLEVDSQNIDALNDLAVILIIKLKFLEAVKLLNQVLEINPENEIALENLTYISEQENFEVNSDFEIIDCPFCGSNKVEEFRKSADIVKCKECDTIYLRTRFNKDKMYEVYQSYADGDSHMSLPTSESEVKSSGLRREYFMEEILEFVKPEGNFLDIGCGWGAFLDNANDKGFTPRGIEMTRKCVSFANENLKIKVTNEQFEDTPFDENSLAVVSMNHVFEHLPFPLEAISKLYKVLKPGGMFCGIVPNINSFASQQQTEEWYWLDPNYHYVHYSPQTIEKHLKNAGFIIERIYTVTGDYGSQNVKKELEKITDFKNGELENMLQNIEKNGEGEEIRFFARKPK